MEATARKSFGGYKPVIRYSDGRTEVCGQNARLIREFPQTKFGCYSERIKHKRGVTFASRDDAVMYAQRVIDLRRMKQACANARLAEVGLYDPDTDMIRTTKNSPWKPRVQQ